MDLGAGQREGLTAVPSGVDRTAAVAVAAVGASVVGEVSREMVRQVLEEVAVAEGPAWLLVTKHRRSQVLEPSLPINLISTTSRVAVSVADQARRDQLEA